MLGLLVARVQPGNGAQDVPVTTAITVDFARDPLPESVSTATLYLEKADGSRVAAQVSLSGRRAVLTPLNPLEPGTRYQATVVGGPQGVRDVLDQYQSSDYTWNFTTSQQGALPAPSLVSPADQAHVSESRPLFTFRAVSGAARYIIQVSRVPDFSTLVWSGTVVDTQQASYSLQPDVELVDPAVHFAQWYWRVRAESSAGQPGIWSVSWQFSTSTLPAVTVVTSPLRLVGTVPEPQSVRLASVPEIKLIFQEDLDPASVGPTTLTVTAQSLTDPQGLPQPLAGQVQGQGHELIWQASGANGPLDLTQVGANQEIVVRLNPGVRGASGSRLAVEEPVVFRFVPVLSPAYTTPGMVRELIGQFLSDVDDYAIWKEILQVSLWADQISAREYGSVNTDFPGRRQQQTDNRIFFHEYARYETAVRLMVAKLVAMQTQAVNQEQLGEFSFRHNPVIVEARRTLQRLEGMRDRAERYLRLGDGTSFTMPQFAALASANRDYPFPRRNVLRGV